MDEAITKDLEEFLAFCNRLRDSFAAKQKQLSELVEVRAASAIVDAVTVDVAVHVIRLTVA